MRLAALLTIALLASCGGSADLDSLCSDQPQIDQGSVYETQAGCPYEQQTTNILAYGTQVSRAGVALTAAGSATAGLVQYSCGRYLMGKDSAGVAVIFDSKSGAVLSHGLVHAGMPISSMPRTLSLPLQY